MSDQLSRNLAVAAALAFAMAFIGLALSVTAILAGVPLDYLLGYYIIHLAQVLGF